MSYIIKRKSIGKNELLDEISQESGKLYSQTVKFFWRTVRKQNIWLKPYSLEKIFNSDKLHAHSSDASIQFFFRSLKSWRELRKSDSSAKPPKKLKKYFPVTWKSSAIKIKNGNLILSNGKIQKPVILKNWKYELPKIAMLRWKGDEYEIIFTYADKEQAEIITNKVVGIDLGQIHIASCSDGMIINGRLLRSTKQWRNKKLSDIKSKLSKKKKKSREWKRLKKAQRKFLETARRKENDMLHKLTTGLVATMKNKGVSTLVVGDLNGYRLKNDCGSKRNQENHNWSYAKTTFMLKYKCEKAGLKFILQEESYTSQTCPNCFNKKKPKGRDYCCNKCNFVGHRDIVGATNILLKYLGGFGSQVVAEMAPAFGIRFNSNINVTSGFITEESTPIYRQ